MLKKIIISLIPPIFFCLHRKAFSNEGNPNFLFDGDDGLFKRVLKQANRNDQLPLPRLPTRRWRRLLSNGRGALRPFSRPGRTQVPQSDGGERPDGATRFLWRMWIASLCVLRRAARIRRHQGRKSRRSELVSTRGGCVDCERTALGRSEP